MPEIPFNPSEISILQRSLLVNAFVTKDEKAYSILQSMDAQLNERLGQRLASSLRNVHASQFWNTIRRTEPESLSSKLVVQEYMLMGYELETVGNIEVMRDRIFSVSEERGDFVTQEKMDIDLGGRKFSISIKRDPSDLVLPREVVNRAINGLLHAGRDYHQLDGYKVIQDEWREPEEDPLKRIVNGDVDLGGGFFIRPIDDI